MNSVELIGRLTRDPELSYTPANDPVAGFTLAVDRPKKDGKNQGADFISIVPTNVKPEVQEAYRNRRAGRYTIEKTHRFDAEGFMKAIRKVEVRGNRYDKDLDKWLKKNQGKYGYKYLYKKAKNKADA